MEDFKIMIVDDEEIILESIKDFFENYNIITYNDSEKALEQLQNSYFDIIIADYKMPNVSGLELLIEGKKNNSYNYGILLTAYAEKKLLEEFINHNLIKKVIEKPLKLELLEDALNVKAAPSPLKKKENRTSFNGC